MADKVIRNGFDDEQRKFYSKRRLDWKFVLDSEAGRRVIWDIIGQSKAFAINGAQDGISLARTEGKRELGLWVMDMIFDCDSEAFGRIIKEHYGGSGVKSDLP